jgi:hypothetical protein
MNEKILEGAFETIITYCTEQPSCWECRFHKENGCFFLICDLPCDWMIPERKGE